MSFLHATRRSLGKPCQCPDQMSPFPQWLKPTAAQLRVMGWIFLAGVVSVPVLFWSHWYARVVNVIPSSLEAEAWPNGEPTLMVDPVDPSRMIASAILLGAEECDELQAGVVISTNGGKTWRLECPLILEGVEGDGTPDWAMDHSLDAVGSASKMYGAYMMPLWNYNTRVIESDIKTDFPATPNVLRDYEDVDQPHIAADPEPTSNDYALSMSMGEPISGCVDDDVRDATVFAGTGAPSSPTCFQERPADMEIPAVRSAWHSSGTVYTVYYLPIDQRKQITDVVVAKGTRNAAGGVTFGAIIDGPLDNTGNPCKSRDEKPGFRLARCVTYPYHAHNDETFGYERRVLSHLSIAVHPKDANIVFVAWGDSTDEDASKLTLHVRASTDGGVTWDATDRFKVQNATNPVLAINDDGKVGFGYQQLVQRADGEAIWETTFVLANQNFLTPRYFTLARTLAAVPKPIIVPNIGDYTDLLAVGKSFFGVFSAGNDFDTSEFPQGLSYVRKKPGTPIMVGYGAMVETSIDPYFFAVEYRSGIARIWSMVSKIFNR